MRKPRVPNRERRVRCVTCGASFTTRHSQGKYCSESCRRTGWRKSWREYGDRNRDDRRQYHRDYYRKNAADVIQRTKKYQATDKGKAVALKVARAQRRKFPQRYAARAASRAAIRAGEIVRTPCEVCGAVKVQSHHSDYSKPLKINWLCQKHHTVADRQRREREKSTPTKRA